MNKNAVVDTTTLSTFKLTSQAQAVVSVTTPEQLREVVQKLHKEKTPFIIVGGGSNTLFAPVITKTLVQLCMSGITYHEQHGTMIVSALAGTVWDELVLDTVNKGYNGLEALSAIPGSVGAAPIQNIGAYGTEVSEHIDLVTVYDIAADQYRSYKPEECGFAYRTSNFKTIWAGKYIVTAVSFKLSTGPAKKVAYPGVEALLPKDKDITANDVRTAIIAIRWSKLPKPEELPNVGSFFHNPIISDEQALQLQDTYPDMPIFPTEHSSMKKLAAGWLIEHCGWKGKSLGPVGMYEKNALVMVNHSDATLDDVLVLQNNIIDAVQEKFGVTLVREPAIVS